MMQHPEPLPRDSVAVTNALSDDECRAMLHYLSGYAPEAWSAALKHIEEFPANPRR